MTEIYIMTVLPERQEYHDYLKEKLPEAHFIYDEKKEAMDTFLRTLEAIGNDSALIMEDDALLTKNFKEKIEAEIRKRPERVIQFFSRRKKDLEVGSREEPGINFNYNICYYVPAGFAKALLKYSEDWYPKNKEEHPTGTDLMVAEFMNEQRMSYYLHVPALVQHRVGLSQINSRRARDRTSKTFQEPWY